MSASLTRTVGFHALHRLYRRDWSEARNREVFGPLADPPGHGHDYECAVTVAGPLDESGMVVDLALLDRVLSEEHCRPSAAGCGTGASAHQGGSDAVWRLHRNRLS